MLARMLDKSIRVNYYQSMNEIEYICPDCGAHVRFFEGFVIECKSNGARISHSFTIPRELTPVDIHNLKEI